MSYLRRRLEKLLSELETGKLSMTPDVGATLKSDLEGVRRASDGTLLLESCSPRLRSLARAYYGAVNAPDRDETPQHSAIAPAVDPGELNRTLFSLQAEYFESMTGSPPERFVPKGSSFGDEIRNLGARLKGNRALAGRLHAKSTAAFSALSNHYGESKNIRLAAARALPGLKAVLGGQQSITTSGVAAVRSTLLYCDTILIPDPVHRWLEKDSDAERFSQIRMLEDIYHLHQLRPLIDAREPGVPILIFPSWERMFEEHDTTTRDGIELLALSMFGKALDASFDDMEELVAYVKREPDAFLAAVERHRLFVAEGAPVGLPVHEAISIQKESNAQWRSASFLDQVGQCTDAELVLMAILNRLGPQFHALDNADSLDAHPLFSLPVQWHYFQTCFDLESAHRATNRTLSLPTLRVLRGLTGEAVSWLANVPLSDIVRLRQDMGSLSFRKSLGEVLSQLNEMTDANLDTSLMSVARGIGKLLADHRREVKRIDEEYQRRHAQTAAGFIVSATGAAFLPWLPALPRAAVAATSGLVAATKFASDHVDKVMRKRQLRRTMMGILAASARS